MRQAKETESSKGCHFGPRTVAVIPAYNEERFILICRGATRHVHGTLRTCNQGYSWHTQPKELDKMETA